MKSCLFIGRFQIINFYSVTHVELNKPATNCVTIGLSDGTTSSLSSIEGPRFIAEYTEWGKDSK